ncbi:flagellin [Caldibacillus thermoamylovorans]|uniref:flagellin n=1 Tax=Caldibacillus thermoamylovorans TaxID=35841 RepID=UPI002559BB16|nr:flagellin [Caldibacillus thermoamylovorans]
MISLIQTAEGALNETHAILQRMRELATQAANDTNTTDDRKEIQKEINQLTSEINRVANTTEFNTKKLLNGDLTGNGGVGANNASATFTFNPVAGATGTTKLNIGGAEYSITFDNTKNFQKDGSDGTTTVVGKTITVYTGSASGGTAPTESELADALVKAFKDMRGADPSLALTEFTFENDSGKFKITANSTGNFAGTAGKDSIRFVSGRSVEITNIVEGSNGSEGVAQLQIGANNGQAFVISINDMSASSLGIAGTKATFANGVTNIEGSPTTGSVGAKFTSDNVVTNGTSNSAEEAALDISTHENATKAIEVIDYAIKNVSAERSKLGAYQNRLEHTINNLSTSSENLTAAESRIRDVDMAKEMMEQTKNAILAQASQAMLAQSQQLPQGVLQLLR